MFQSYVVLSKLEQIAYSRSTRSIDSAYLFTLFIDIASNGLFKI